MTLILDIFITIVAPVFLMIGIGILLERLFKLDLATMSKLNFYVFVPALVFIKIMESTLAWSEVQGIALFTLLQVAALSLFCRILFHHPSLREHCTVMTMGMLFYNAGNFGLPLADMAYGATGVGIISIILLVQNLVSFTYGIWLLEAGRRNLRKMVLGLLKVPVLHAIWIAMLLRGLHLTPPDLIAKPLDYLGAGLIPIALLTLGVQLSRTKLTSQWAAVSTTVATRLLLAPLISAVLLLLFPFGSTMKAVCITAAGLPVAVNVFILATEYGHDSELASQIVFWSTLLSAISLPLVIACVPQ